MSKHRNVRLLAVHNFFLDFRPYTAIAIVYFAQVTGSFALGMTVFSAIMLSAAALEVPTGIFSDMIGRRRTIIFGSGASVLSLLLYALGGSIWMLLLGALCEGMSRSFFSGNNDALLHETLTQQGKADEYADTLGKTSSMFQAGLAMGALVAAAFAVVSLQFVVWLSVIPQFCCFIVSFFFIEPRIHPKGSTNVFEHMKDALRQFKENEKLRLLSIGSIIQFGVGEAMFQLQPAFIASLWPPWAIGIARMLNHLFAWMSFWFAGRIIRRFSAMTCLFFVVIVSAVIELFAYGYPSIASPLMMAVTSIFFGLFLVSQNTLLQKEFTEKQRATMGSINSLFGSLFFGICAVSFGMMADLFGSAIALMVGACIALSLLPLYWRLFKHR